MATRAGDITFGVGFQVDKSGLQQVQQSLQQIQNMSKEKFMELNPTLNTTQAEQQLKALKKTAQDVGIALNNSFNAKLNTFNLSTFNKQLQTAEKTVDQLYRQFSQAGEIGAAAFRQMTTQSLTANVQLKQSNQLLTDMGKTLLNSFKYTLSYGTLNLLSSSIQNAFQYSKALDSSLNDIRIVTDKSADDMERFAQSANKAAKELGQSTTDYTKASLIYYQQGLKEADVTARTDVTLKAANVTGQSTQEVSEQLTAVWNGYKVSAAEAELYVDKLAAVAATTASDLEELSTGMSKVASAANAMGVDVDQLNGMLSTIVSVTRQAPESAGTALKTIFARMGDLKIDGEDEFGVSLGEVSGQLAEVGVNIMNAKGELRDMGEVIEEVGQKWNSGVWSRAEKQAIAIELAGKRQYNNLLALFDNWDMYNKAVETSMESQGTLQKQQDIYMESTVAHLQKMRTSLEGVKDSLLGPNDINPILDGLTSFIEILEKAVDMVGGLQGLFAGLAPVILKAMGPSLASGIDNIINNRAIEEQNQALYQSQMSSIYNLKNSSAYKEDTDLQKLVDSADKLYSSYKVLEPEQQKQLQNMLLQQQKASETAKAYDNMAKSAAENAKNYADDAGFSSSSVKSGYGTQTFKELQKDGDEFLKRLQKIGSSTDEDTKKLQQMQRVVKDAFIDGDYSFALKNMSKDSHDAIMDIVQDQSFVDEGWEGWKNKIRQVESEFIKMKKTGEDGLGAMSAEAQKARQESQDLGNALETALNSAERTSSINSFIQLSTSISQMVFAVNTLSNAFKALGNDSLSANEKISQIFMAASMGLPSLISSFNSLKESLGVTNSLWTVLNATEGTGLALGELTVALFNKKKMQAIIDNNLRILSIKLSKQEAFESGEVTAAELLELAAKEGNAAATTDLAGRTKILINLQQKLAASILANPFVAVAAAIVVATTAIIAYKNHLDEVAKAERQANLERIQSNDKLIKEAENNKTLVDSYNKLYNEYQKTGEVKEELVTSTEDLIEQYNIEDGQLLLLQDDYETLTQRINESRQAEIERQKTLSQGNLNRISQDAENAEKGAWYQNSIEAVTVSKHGNASKLTLNQDVQDLIKITEHQSGQQQLLTYTIDINWNDPDDASKQIAALQKQIEDWNAKGVNVQDPAYKIIDQYLKNDEISKYIDELNTNLASLDQSFLQEADYAVGGLDNALDFKDFKDKVEKFKEELKDNTRLTEEQISNYVSSLKNSYSKMYTGYQLQLEKMNEDTKKYVEDMSAEDLAVFLTLKVDENSSKQSIQRSIDAINRQIDTSDAYNTADIARNLGRELKDSKITKNEQKQINSDIAALKVIDPSMMEGFENKTLYEQQQILNDMVEKQQLLLEQKINMSEEDSKSLALQEAQNEKVAKKESIEKEIENLYKERATLDTDKIGDKIRYEDITKSIQEAKNSVADLDKELQAITNGTYEVDIQIATEDDIIASLDFGVDSFINEANAIQSAAELVEENFKISSDNLDVMRRELPELLRDVEAAEEGYAQLSKETVEQVLQDKQEELKADAEIQKQKIQFQIDALESEIETSKKEVEAVKQAAADGVSIEDLKTGKIKGINADFGNWLYQEYQSWVTDQNNALKKGVENAESAAQAEINLVAKITDAYRQRNMAARGDLTAKVDTAISKGGYTGSSDFGGPAENSLGSGTLEDYNYKKRKEDLTKEFYNEVVSAMNDSIKEDEANLAILQEQRAKIDTNLESALASLGRAAEGKAGKKAKDKSSSSKESEDKKQLLKLEDEIDLYREVNEQLEEVDHNLKILQKQEDRTYGAQHIENLKAQSAELAKQQKLIEKKLGLTKRDLAMRQKLLSAQGVQFGADGDISNYQALLTEKINNINALYTQYNSTLDKALKSTIKTQADNAKEEYESLKKSIEAYEKLQDQMDQLNEQWQDARNAEIDKQIEAFNYRIDLDLNVAKATKRWNEFKRKVVDDMENIADPVKKVIEQMKAGIEDYRTTYSAGGEVAINTGAVRETLDQFNQMMATGTASIYGNNPAQLIADLEKRKEDLMKSVEDAEQMIADMRKMYLDGLDEAYDKMEKHTDQYEYISNLIEHDINLIELLRGEEAYEDMGRYYDRQAQNNIKNVEFLKMQRDALKEQVDSLEKDSKAWKKVYQQLQDTEMELRDSVNESVQLLLDRYENGLNKILKDLDKKVSGGMGVDYLQEQYEMQQDLADNYLDSVNQAYALEKLRAKFTKAINDTTDIKAREKLTNLLHEQVDTLAEKEKLAQYEVDHAEKMLEVEQARIALEEAQANKSQMRLKRDNQGNYSYQYVADEDAIDEAQQDLLDAENDLWNFDVGGLRTAREEAIKIWQEYFEKLREIWEDTSLTEEERQQKLLDLDNWRTGELEANVEKYNFFKTNTEQDANTILADLYSQNADEFGRVVMEEILPDWNSGVDNMIEKYAGEGIPACQEALAQLQANTEEYRTKVDELADAAGMDFEEICNGIDMTIDYTYSLMNTNEEMIDQYRREMDELNELNRILEDVQREFQAAREEAIRMADEATKAIQRANELRAASEAAKAAADAAAASASQSSYYGGGGSGSSSGSGYGSKSNSSSSAEKVNGFGPYNGFTDYKLIVEGQTTRTNITEAEAKRIAEDLRRRGVDARAVHMATGGYTGDWHSSEGKMAVLHEKELVLNKHDTENMLDAVNVVRHIVASLDGSMFGRLADMSALAFNSITPGIETSNETLEQNVHIEASFPNATNRNEIEEAFNNLVNIASQKALNTRR